MNEKIFKRIIIIVFALFMTFEIATSFEYWVGDYKSHFVNIQEMKLQWL